ncbi:NAD-dependent epimerase/dehydratase family protein [Cellulosimicrobium marinum]|uniref:NAD-dependent epimerase/dehydratase family protein n=1 Tax=Cellulosimicrobium marinum TaxID=1638992 RepID=UPI001E380865|nr:NAD-dependent epimerase/dehydratase family protein [Cellulosimicrobium marinum]MCB7137277.1 NAD-dependent epimerase/dehydratase family protein [Cellulosimicrobium marinum]
MTVLVTGASGLLGGAVARALVARGDDVRTLQRRPSGVPGVEDVLGSVTDPAAVARAVEGVDAVVHLAAKVSLAGEPAEFHAVNVDGTRALLDAAERAGVERFVQVSSPSVAHLGSSLVGAGTTPADPRHARGDYARTKAAAELLALGRDRRRRPGGAELSDGSGGTGPSVVAVRPHIVWGPGDTQLVERVLERAASGRLPLLGHGAALIDTLYVDNAADGILAALDRAHDVHGRAYVLTNGEPRTVADLLTGICRAGGVEPPRWRVPAGVARAAGSLVEAVWRVRPGTDEPPMTRFLAEQLSTAHWFDQRATRRDLRWQPAVSVDEGLRRLAAHYGGTAA